MTGTLATLHFFIYLGIAIQFAGLLSFLGFYFFKRPRRAENFNLPGLTIIKPCFGNADGEDRIFDSYFNQDYHGPVQLIFVVTEITDPIVPVVEEYLKKYPKADASLLVSKTRKAYWRKIDAYYDGYQVAKHDFVVITDSDTIVKSSYAREMVAALGEPGVSVVTVPQYDVGADSFGTALKTVGNNCDVAVYVMLMNLFVRKKRVAWGHSLAFRRSEFDQFGEEAWEKLRNQFGDDLVLPSLFTDHGKKVVFRNIFCPVQYSGKTLKQMLDQQRRFALCQKAALGPATFIFGLLLFPHVTAAANILLSKFSVASLVLFGEVFAARVFVSLVFEGLIFGSVRGTAKYFWTIPLWDLLKVYFSYYVFGRSTVWYHGREYRVTNSARLVLVGGPLPEAHEPFGQVAEADQESR